jgi:hypothetical protein
MKQSMEEEMEILEVEHSTNITKIQIIQKNFLNNKYALEIRNN